MGMDWTTDSEFGDKVAKLCIDKYSSLPRTGKPQVDKEWTLLAGVVLCMAKEGGYSLEIVSLATGSKCIGKSKMSKTGEVLNDSHAEVLAKRAFLRYIYSQILELHKSGDSTVLQSTTGGRCRVKAGISFHMYTSHTPCGDASIFPKEDDVNYDNKNSESGIGTIVAGDESMPDSKRSFKAESSDLDQLIQKNTEDDTKINECSINRDKLSESCLDSKVKETHDKVHEKTEVYSETETCGTPAKTDIESLNEGRIKAKRKRESEDIRNADRLAKLFKTEEISDRCLDAISDKNQAHAEKLDKTEEEVARMTENKEEKASQLQGSDIYRTGAKCVNGGLQDPKGKGNNYHVTGAFRIKPGRGERTLSMSCSDKMASWNIVGCQGALLSHFLSAPIYFSSVTVGRCPYSHDAMQRALVSRSSSVEKLPTKFKLNTPKLLQSQIRFHHGKDVVMKESMKAGKEMKIVPCSSALAWTRIGYCSELLDVTTHGRKHGVTTKNLHKPQARSALCSKNLFDLFLSLIEDIQLQDRPSTLQNEELKTYKDFKMAAKAYQTAWQQLLEVYKAWEHKPEGYLDFT